MVDFGRFLLNPLAMTSPDPESNDESTSADVDDAWVDAMWYEFGEWLAGQRVRLGLTKRQAAERAELSPSTWSTIEQGGRTVRGEWIFPSPGDTTLVRIAKAVQIDPWEVFEMLKRPWRDELDPAPGRYRPNLDDPHLSPSATRRGSDAPGDIMDRVTINFFDPPENIPADALEAIKTLLRPYFEERR